MSIVKLMYGKKERVFKFLTLLFTCSLCLNAHAISVVTANVNGTSGVYGPNNSITTSFLQTIQTSPTTQSIFGTSSNTMGQLMPNKPSMINGVSYDVWMNGPVLSRYYNTNIHNAARNYYAVDGTLPLVNQTVMPGFYNAAAMY